FFFFQAEDGIRDLIVTGVKTCALPISARKHLERGDVGAAREAAQQALTTLPGHAYAQKVLGRLGPTETPAPEPSADGQSAFEAEIGRASCRERAESPAAAGAGRDKKME